jgi:hypothetical protein
MAQGGTTRPIKTVSVPKPKRRITIMENRKPKDKKVKVVKQKSDAQFNKAKALILSSIKILANQKIYVDKAIILAKDLTALKKIKKGDVATFWASLKPLGQPKAMAIDSASEKAGYCNHARLRQHIYNPTARAIGRPDLVVEYGTKKPKAKKQKAKASKK